MHAIEDELRDKLAEFSSPSVSTPWGAKRADLRKHLEICPRWNDFKNWPVVRGSLYSGMTYNSRCEYDLIKGSEFDGALHRMQAVGSGTAIHQAYALSWSRFDYEGRGSILEFGGGYGEMYRLLTTLGYAGHYNVYDFPELLILQEYYLRSKDIPLNYWHPHYDCESLADVHIDTFISLCGLSEAPLKDREILFKTKPNYILLRVQPLWDGINNMKWLEDNFSVMTTQLIPGFPNHTMVEIARP